VAIGLAVVACSVGCDWLLGLRKLPAGESLDAASSITPVQNVTEAAGSAMTIHHSLDRPAAQGNVLAIVGAAVNGSLTKPSGGGVTTWTPVARSTKHTNVEIWVGVVDTDDSPVVITCGTCTATEQMWMSITEWPGLLTTNLVEGGSGSAGSAAGVATPGMVNTLHAPDLLILGVSTAANIATDVPDWTALSTINEMPITQLAWYRVTATTDTYTAQVTVTDAWDAALAALRASPIR
jgi:hypothetical protein